MRTRFHFTLMLGDLDRHRREIEHLTDIDLERLDFTQRSPHILNTCLHDDVDVSFDGASFHDVLLAHLVFCQMARVKNVCLQNRQKMEADSYWSCFFFVRASSS